MTVVNKTRRRKATKEVATSIYCPYCHKRVAYSEEIKDNKVIFKGAGLKFYESQKVCCECGMPIQDEISQERL